MLSRHVSKGNPSALVNVCIWFVSRAHRWASKPLREVLSFFRPWGGLSKIFFRAAADVFFGRAASVETCECRARLTDRRDGAGRFARRPAAAQYERPVKSPAGFCCAKPHGLRYSATVHAVSSLCNRAGAHGCCSVRCLLLLRRGARRLQLASAAFLRAALLPEASCPTSSLHPEQQEQSFCLPQ